MNKFSIFLLVFTCSVQAGVIDIFDLEQNKDKYLLGPDIKFHAIDLNKNLMTDLNAELEFTAIKLFKLGREISKNEATEIFAKYQPQLELSFQPIATAINQDIKQIPAISFANGKAVVYGNFSLQEAIDIYKSKLQEENFDA